MSGEPFDVTAVDVDQYDYVVDKGAVTDFELHENGDLQSFSSLRVFGLRKGYAEFMDVPGHYVMNSWTGAEPIGTQCLLAPALVHFKDRGLAPAFVLEWKVTNEKVYGMTLPTAVKTGTGGDPDKSEKWLTSADISPVKLALIESVQTIVNRDGLPLKKNLDAWLSNHSGERRKALKLTSLAAHRQWCDYTHFSANMAAVAAVAQTALEKAVRDGDRSGAAKQIEAAISKRLPPLLRMTESLTQHIKLIAVPLSHRFIETEIDLETEVGDMRQVLQDLLKHMDPDSKKTDLLVQMLEKDNRFTNLKSG